ncbi:MAG: hypothetical protein PF961_12990 [Planctomycetota bacterium]|jgi:hypothetical protein|nr:hypothetical protein [Planctomycetota bacterium]
MIKAALALVALMLIGCGSSGGSGSDGAGDGSNGSGADGPLPTPSATSSLSLSVGTYLPTSSEQPVAADIAADGRGLAITSNHLSFIADDGAVSLIDAPGTVKDGEVSHATGAIAVTGSATWLLNSNGSGPQWTQNVAGDRVSVGDANTVGVLKGSTVSVIKSGAVTAFSAGTGNATDIAVDDSNDLVIVSGWTQVGGNLQQPWVRAFSFTGSKQWTAYNWSEAQAGSNRSDARAEGLSMGRDGKLYLIGVAKGGTSTFRKLPGDVSSNAPNAEYSGAFQRTSDVGDVLVAYLGRLNPADGSLIKGTFLLTRLKSGKGNSITFDGIDADANGTIIAGGHARWSIKDADLQVVGNRHTENAGMTVAIFDSDFRIKTWVNLSTNDKGTVRGVGAANGRAVIAADINWSGTRATPVLHAATQTTPSASYAARFDLAQVPQSSN